MELENSKEEAENAAEATSKIKSSKNKTHTSLKDKSEIAKKSPALEREAKNNFHRRQDRNNKKTVSEGNVENKKGRVSEGNVENKKRRPSEGNVENRKRSVSEDNAENNKKRVSEVYVQNDKSKEQGAEKLNSKKDSQDKNATNEMPFEKIRERTGGSDRKYKKQKKRRIEKKNDGPEKISRNTKSKEKHDGIESCQNEKKKEKLGGLIFMCSAKTKPDCFRYNVMGVSMNKKDLVLRVKPGLKLFLYDFDLKLMYGIYQASSIGGIRLEPKAFGGAFPVQVRFSIHKDCYPIPEGMFKKAIMENYNEKHKFKTELSVEQVRKLMKLFRPVTVHSTVQPVRFPPPASIRGRKVYEGVKESWSHSSKETYAGDLYANGSARHYPVLSDEGDQSIGFGKVASTRTEEYSHGLFLTEKEYRAYGLRGARKNLTPPHHTVPSSDPLQNGHEREHLQRHMDPVHLVHRDAVPAHLTERAYPAYDVGARQELSFLVPAAATTVSTVGATTSDFYARDPYYAFHYGASSADHYLAPPKREEVSLGSYRVDGRTEAHPIEYDRADRLYLTHAADALSDYNRRRQYQGVNPEAASAPVSSRYSFAGPSMSYR